MKKYIAPVSKVINLAGESPLLANSDIDAQIIEGTSDQQGSNRRSGSEQIWGFEE